MTESRISFWLASGALLISCLTLIINTYFQHKSRQDSIDNEIRQHRQQALLLSLKIVDHVYANVNFNDSLPSNPHTWDLQEAREAMNAITIYCQYPNETLDTFRLALGVYNPEFQHPIGIKVKYLSAFRRQVARELNLDVRHYDDTVSTWIYHLPGGN